MLPNIYLAIAAAAVINLDRQCLGQVALSRPLVTGLLVGNILEQPIPGLVLGIWADLFWLRRHPLGGDITPNGGLAVAIGLISLFVTTRLHQVFPISLLPLLCLTFAALVPLAHLATWIERLVRTLANRFSQSLKESIIDGQDAVCTLWPNVAGLAATLVFSLIFLILGTASLTLILEGARIILPVAAWLALGKMAPFIPIIGLAFLTQNLKPARLAIYIVIVLVSLALMSQLSA
jgi:mannose/fructose/N-acetylgalactosamine-specific phosphotransferase system component IIC